MNTADILHQLGILREAINVLETQHARHEADQSKLADLRSAAMHDLDSLIGTLATYDAWERLVPK